MRIIERDRYDKEYDGPVYKIMEEAKEQTGDKNQVSKTNTNETGGGNLPDLGSLDNNDQQNNQQGNQQSGDVNQSDPNAQQQGDPNAQQQGDMNLEAQEDITDEKTYYYKQKHLSNIYRKLTTIKKIIFLVFPGNVEKYEKYTEIIDIAINSFYIIIHDIEKYWDEIEKIIILYYKILNALVKIIYKHMKESGELEVKANNNPVDYSSLENEENENVNEENDNKETTLEVKPKKGYNTKDFYKEAGY